MTLRRLAAAALLAVASPLAAGAQATLTFPSSLANPVAGGYYVGPYAPATFVSAVGQARTLSVLCLDFLNEVYLGDQYQVNVTSLGGGASNQVPDTRHPGAVGTYRKAAWLGSLFSSTPTTGWGSVQYAMWNLFTPTDAPDDVDSPGYLALADLAESHDYGAFDYQGRHYDAVDMSRYWVLTDVTAEGRALGGKQEFITTSDIALGPTNTVPEPGTLVLILTGAGAIGVLAWRRVRA